MPPDFLIITVGLWIQDKLLGNASFVLGLIGMFHGVPAILFERYSGTWRVPLIGTTDHECLGWPLRQLTERAQGLFSDQTSKYQYAGALIGPWQVSSLGIKNQMKYPGSCVNCEVYKLGINEKWRRDDNVKSPTNFNVVISWPIDALFSCLIWANPEPTLSLPWHDPKPIPIRKWTILEILVWVLFVPYWEVWRLLIQLSIFFALYWVCVRTTTFTCWPYQDSILFRFCHRNLNKMRTYNGIWLR